MAVRNRRAPRRVRKARKARVPRVPLAAGNQHATIQETIFINQNSGVTANTYTNRTFSLFDCPRSLAVAVNYKYCRAVEVSYKYTPQWNTFQEDVAGTSPTLPQMHYIMNRTQDSFVPATKNTQIQYMLTAGAVPKAFNKNIVVKYRPNWTSAGLSAAVLNTGSAVAGIYTLGAKVQYGWIPTPDALEGSWVPPTAASQGILPIAANAATALTQAPILPAFVVYNGHSEFFNQSTGNTSTSNFIGTVEVTVRWEFKGAQGAYYNPRDPPPVKSTGETGATGESL